MDINNLLSQLGGGSKPTVYMSVTPNIGLEMITVDNAAKQVKSYAYRPLAYNESLREIADYEQFKQATTEMLDELGIPYKCNIILNLPMVYFGSKEIQLMVDNEGISSIVTSEVEQSYIFKRYEPVVNWVESNYHTSNETRKVFFTAVQQNVIDNIKSALSEIGATLSEIEISLNSLLRALSFTGLASNQMKEGTTWNLMIINQNGYSICSMMGNKVIDYYEEALAVKSFEGEEIYKAFNASAQLTLMSYPANYLYIISEADGVSAEILANRLQIDGNIQALENNNFKKDEFIPASLDVIQENVLKISMEAIGVAISRSVASPLKFNILGSETGASGDVAIGDDSPAHIKIGENEYEISPQLAIKLAIIADIPIIILTLILFITVPLYAKKLDTQLQDVKTKIQDTQSQISALQEKQKKSGNFDVKNEIKNVLETNKTKLMSYAAIGESVPKNLWITYFVAKDNSRIDIKGEASNVKDIYTFFRGMKDSLLNVQLRLHKLEMDTGSLDDAVAANPNKPINYTFEITNMTNAELAPPEEKTEKATENSDEKQQNSENEENKPGLSPLGTSPLVNFNKK